MVKRKKSTSTLVIKEHILVPKHAKLSEKEKKELLDKYKITVKELPKIYKNDPAIREMALEVGDVVKIIRKSATAGESVYFRGVASE